MLIFTKYKYPKKLGHVKSPTKALGKASRLGLRMLLGLKKLTPNQFLTPFLMHYLKSNNCATTNQLIVKHNALKRLLIRKNFRSLRMRKNKPLRGQRTHTNARTRRRGII